MVYNLNNKNIRIPDAEITKSMKLFGITKDEAINMWLEDEGYLENAEVEELTAKAKVNKVNHEAKSENSAKKARKPREKKQNTVKLHIIRTIYYALQHEYGEDATITVTNDEKYIDFVTPSGNFTINLVQHREKKTK